MGVAETSMETAAEGIVAAYLGGVAVQRDVPGGPPGLHDFDVQVSSRTVAGVEVTSIQVSQGRATQSVFTKLRTLDIGLSSSWSASIWEQRKMAPIVKGAVQILNALENVGMARFMDADQESDPNIRALVAQANRLGIASGFVLPAKSPPRLYCSGFD